MRRLFEAASLDEMGTAPKIAVYIILAFWTLVVLFPLYWVLVTSFKIEVQVDSGPYFIPFVDFKPTLDAWDFMLVKNNTIGPYLNSLVVALSSTVLAILIGTLAAYALVRIKFEVKIAAILGGRERDLHFVIGGTRRSKRDHADGRGELIASSVGKLALSPRYHVCD
jgi:multiple sugar transport system permease protein